MKIFVCALLACLIAPVAWAANFSGKVVGVTDGDTITVVTEQPCHQGKNCKFGKLQIKIRLAEIDAPEKKQPFGNRAKQVLAEMVFWEDVEIEQQTIDRYGRVVANIYVNDLWINAEMVRTGHAWVYRQYAKSPTLLRLESDARKERLGIWSLPESDLLAPWEWRRK